MKKALLIVAGVLSAAIITASAKADDLILGTGAEPTSIDPHYWSGFPNIQLGLSVFGHLVNYNSKFQITPGLATSWKPLDETTWEFKLRDTKWHDGTPLSAEDIIFTFKRAPDTGLKQFGNYIRGKEIKRIDDRTIHIMTQKPDPLVPNAMAAFGVVSAKHGDAPTEDYNSGKATVGIGPFKFVEWVKGDRLVLEANPNYWEGKSEWDRVILKPITSGPSRIVALLNGDVDMIDYVPTADIPLLKKNEKLNVSQTPSCRVIFLSPDQGSDVSPFVRTNDGEPMFPNPLRDWRVRKAMRLAIDRAGIVERVMDGNAVPASQQLGRGLFGYNPNLPVDKFDPEGAKALLAKAGYGDGFRLTIHGTNDRYDNDAQILEALAQMLTQVGITTEVQPLPKSVFFSRNAKREFSLSMVGNCSSTAEASSPLREFHHTYYPNTPFGVYNRQRYSNSRLDPIIEAALATMDDAKRTELFHTAMEIAVNDVSTIPLHQQVNTWATRKGVVYEARTDEMTLPYYAKKQ